MKGSSTHTVINESILGHFGRIVEIPAVENYRLPQQFLHLYKIRIAELVPFRDNDETIRAFKTLVVSGRIFDGVPQKPAPRSP